ncbi:MAG: acetyltransferase [Halobacteria archaeon]|nr:acetyltransferase [Halobacteria archaeon]
MNTESETKAPESDYDYVVVESFADNETLGEMPRVHETAYIDASELGDWTEVRKDCRIVGSTFDDYSYAMERVQMTYTRLGKFCSVASDARINPSNHPISRPTSHHMTYRRRKYGFDDSRDDDVFEWRRDNPVEVGHDVWIGHGATVLPDVTVGNGAVVGAGAVVTDDVEPYTVVCGVPARPVRRRFTEDTATKIEETEWWNWSHDELKKNIEKLSDLDEFLDEFAD